MLGFLQRAPYRQGSTRDLNKKYNSMNNNNKNSIDNNNNNSSNNSNDSNNDNNTNNSNNHHHNNGFIFDSKAELRGMLGLFLCKLSWCNVRAVCIVTACYFLA